MLPRLHRLILRDISPPFTTWRKNHQVDGLVVYFRKKPTQATNVILAAQGAVVVSKKTLPLAVERNTTKRQVRVILAAALPHLQSDIQIVILVRKRDWMRAQLLEMLHTQFSQRV